MVKSSIQKPQELPSPGALVETDEDDRQASLANKQAIPIAKPITGVAVGAGPQAKPAEPYRPTIRPTGCLLTVFDDGKTEGETIRIRSPRFVIGRTQGDLTFPLDEQISGQHVEIALKITEGKSRWVIADLQSSNGLFIRVSRTILADKSELLIGKGRYRFECANPALDQMVSESETSGTLAWGGHVPLFQCPTLVEIIPGGAENRIVLKGTEYWIGSHGACGICRDDDPFTDSKHARLFRDPKGRWNVQSNNAMNGIWLRTCQMEITDGFLFQIGEQRFRVKRGG